MSEQATPHRPRLFISYKRDADPDDRVAQQIFEALKNRYDVFMDITLPVGSLWAKSIDDELHDADYFIALLSAQSVQSEMVIAEIETANELYKQRKDRPRILPVRLCYRDRLPSPLNGYLNKYNWALWDSHADTERLISELKQAIISGAALSQEGEATPDNLTCPSDIAAPEPSPSASIRFDEPVGAVSMQNPFYVERPTDATVMNSIKGRGVTITILGPRQVGKTSLLIRASAEAVKAGKRVVFYDFQSIDTETLKSAEKFFRHFCSWVTYELELTDRVDEYWKYPFGNIMRCTQYMSRHILKQLSAPLVLALDEVESVMGTDFQSDFFSMLRNWHNSRALFNSIWPNLDLLIVTSTDPYLLIENENQSPFNVGTNLLLGDFTPTQVTRLNNSHGSPLQPAEVDQLMTLLGGHPFLVRLALHLMATRQLSIKEFFDRASDDDGPFSDHLRYYLFRLKGKAELIEGLRQVIVHRTCQDEQILFRLQGAGLVRRQGEQVLPRCQLYADYFKKHLSA